MKQDNNTPEEYSLEDADPIENNGTAAEEETAESDDEYSLEDDEDEEEGEEEYGEEGTKKRKSTPSAWKLMLGMMLNPVEGWKKIRRSRLSVEEVARQCFYPLTGIAALSCFLEIFWQRSIGLNVATINALKVFVAFFFGNYLALMFIRILFPNALKEIADTEYGKNYVMYNLSTLALFYILYGCLPMLGPVLVFLPIWTIYLIIRGSRFFMLPAEKASLLRTLLCVFIIGAPILVYFVLDIFL